MITFRTYKERQVANDYATPDQFCRIFEEDMQSFYLLAFLLTASHEHAEQCFFAAMEDALKERRVFKGWARSWSRRLVINNAIHLIAAPFGKSYEQPGSLAEANDESGALTTISAVTHLASFDRIVFVMSVLERYSEWECALLLDCSTRDVQRARIRALQELPALYAATAAG
jgi:DNA-directed RNA polymerase specialized sigma24 family protein